MPPKGAKGSKGEPILEIGDSHESVRPKIRWDIDNMLIRHDNTLLLMHIKA